MKSRPIAMKCTQEQFENIKPNLEGIKNICDNDFITYPYLTSPKDKNHWISNHNKDTFNKNREIYETWNERIFLEACGIEVEQTYEITKEQILELKNGYKTEKLREWFPTIFEEEKLFNEPTLSLNDILSVWRDVNNIELHKTATIFKSFEKLARSKKK